MKSTKLECAFCQGKGTQPGTDRISCVVCGGSGRVKVRPPYNICKECEGKGKKLGANLYCLACHGKGVIEKGAGKKITRKARRKKKKVKK